MAVQAAVAQTVALVELATLVEQTAALEVLMRTAGTHLAVAVVVLQQQVLLQIVELANLVTAEQAHHLVIQDHL
jgi:hypothetical protein